MLSMIGSQNRFMVMVLATSRKLCLRLAHAPNGTQGILISYCVMRILRKSLAPLMVVVSPTGLYGFYCPLVSNVVHSYTSPPILRWYKCHPLSIFPILKISVLVSALLSKPITVKLSAFIILKYR